jgi:hypothetical protein
MTKPRKTRQEGYTLCKGFERKLKEDGYSIFCVDVCWPCQNYIFYWFICKDKTYKRFQTSVREVIKELKTFSESKSKKDKMLPMTDAFFTAMARRGFFYMRDTCYNDTFEEEVEVLTTGCYMEKHRG